MFTGIINGSAAMSNVQVKDHDMSFWLKLPKSYNSKIGDSIAVNGVCLTIAEVKNELAKFELMHETIKRTNFSDLKEGSVLNIEDSLRVNDKLDGHLVYGDVDSVGQIVNIKKIGDSIIYTIKFPSKYSVYLIDKGRVTIDGASLTVINSNKDTFQISLIPHSLKVLNIVSKRIGEYVNIEYDIYAKVIYKQSGGKIE